ncbi:MAG: amidase [Gordonia sp. (in: high G+C Gram-positive bacteria)]
MTVMFLNGTAMLGMRDYHNHRGSKFLDTVYTAPAYRFLAVRDEFPGLYPTQIEGFGRRIEGELHDIPDDVLTLTLLPSEPEELEFGHVVLSDGTTVRGMLLMPSRLTNGDKVTDISDIGGFRRYLKYLESNSGRWWSNSPDPL